MQYILKQYNPQNTWKHIWKHTCNNQEEPTDNLLWAPSSTVFKPEGSNTMLVINHLSAAVPCRALFNELEIGSLLLTRNQRSHYVMSLYMGAHLNADCKIVKGTISHYKALDYISDWILSGGIHIQAWIWGLVNKRQGHKLNLWLSNFIVVISEFNTRTWTEAGTEIALRCRNCGWSGLHPCRIPSIVVFPRWVQLRQRCAGRETTAVIN